MQLVNSDSYKAISLSQELCDLARPLKVFGIHYFNHIRIFSDGSRVSLGTNGSWLKHFFDNAYYKIGNFSSKTSSLDYNYLLWKLLPSDGVLEVASKEFNIDNGITFIEKKQLHTDLYLFASTRNNDAVNNFYINNLDILKHFINYYNEKSRLLISSCVPDRLIQTTDAQLTKEQIVTEPHKKSIILSSCIDRFYSETIINKVRFNYSGKEIVISINQYQIIILLLKGYAIKEIAKALKLTPKTCQIYIDQTKSKFNCNTRNELLTLFRSNNLENC